MTDVTTTQNPPTASGSVADAASHSRFTRSITEGLEAAAPPVEAAPAVVRPAWKPPAWTTKLWANKRVRYGGLAFLLVAGGLGAFFALRPVPQPDYAEDPMDDVLNYTLLTDEFNKLPIDKRLELLGELIQRIKMMSGDDSALMAAFAASIDTDKLRKQLEENASRLALDVWDKYAIDYQAKGAEQRDEYLDQTLLNMEKMMETVAGVSSDKTDEQRLEEARKQAKSDQDMLSKGEGPTAGQLTRMADMMRNRVGQHSAPQQQQRGMQLMRDMTRHLRGQDAVTGKPLPQGGG
jgi:hypothetical protein